MEMKGCKMKMRLILHVKSLSLDLSTHNGYNKNRVSQKFTVGSYANSVSCINKHLSVSLLPGRSSLQHRLVGLVKHIFYSDLSSIWAPSELYQTGQCYSMEIQCALHHL